MKMEDLQNLFEQEQVRELCWDGKCHECEDDVEVVARVEDDGKVMVSGGSVYRLRDGTTFLKCPVCFATDPVLRNYQSMEVYSRVVGYLRPVKQFNAAKQEEFYTRKNFDFNKVQA